MLQGELLYFDLIDIKPPGIFLLFSLQLWLFKSIFFIRLMAAVAVGLTAYGLFCIKYREHRQLPVAIAGGVLYLLLTGIFTNYGLAVNTEIYFNFFTVWSLYWFQKGSVRAYWVGGLLMGGGFIVKYVVLFDFLAFMFWGLLGYWFVHKPALKVAVAKMLPRGLVAMAGLSLPFLLCYAYYQMIGHADDFYFITRVAPQRYIKSFQPLAMLLLVGDFFLRFLPVTLLAIWTFVKTPRPEERYFSALWLLFATIAVVAPGNRFFHYTVQLMPPLAWLAANFFAPQMPRPNWFLPTRTSPTKIYATFALLLGVLLGVHFNNFYWRVDRPRQVAQYLNRQLRPDESLYVANSQQIYYFLTDRNCPTPYVHNTLLFDKQHLAVLCIDSTQHLRQILDKHPSYILQTGNLSSTYLAQHLAANYTVKQTMENVTIWHAKEKR